MDVFLPLLSGERQFPPGPKYTHVSSNRLYLCNVNYEDYRSPCWKKRGRPTFQEKDNTTSGQPKVNIKSDSVTDKRGGVIVSSQGNLVRIYQYDWEGPDRRVRVGIPGPSTCDLVVDIKGEYNKNSL